jgi:hypothetical protein
VFLTAGLVGTVYAGVLGLWLPESIRIQTLADGPGAELTPRIGKFRVLA